jgi:hypothetical protein
MNLETRSLAVAVVLGCLTTPAASQPAAAVLESAASAEDLALSTDPADAAWAKAPRVQITRDMMGNPVAGPPTEVRSRWTRDHLYLLFICPYTELNLKPDPTRTGETPRLWTWDVAEAFIGSDNEHIWRYKEFQVSPQGEWLDLDIDRRDPRGQGGPAWNSGFSVSARIDADARTWYGVMRIPFSAIDARAPQEGRELRLGLFRLGGRLESRASFAWQPTAQPTFHVPEVFGVLRLR